MGDALGLMMPGIAKERVVTALSTTKSTSAHNTASWTENIVFHNISSSVISLMKGTCSFTFSCHNSSGSTWSMSGNLSWEAEEYANATYTITSTTDNTLDYDSSQLYGYTVTLKIQNSQLILVCTGRIDREYYRYNTAISATINTGIIEG